MQPHTTIRVAVSSVSDDNFDKTVSDSGNGIHLRIGLHGAIYRSDSSVMMLRYCANLKAVRYESTSLNRIVADKLHRIIVQFIAPILL